MRVNAAFIFVAPEVDCKVHRTVVDTPVVRLTVVGVKNYTEAVEVAKELVEQGVKAIELCAGFGNEGIALVSKAVKGKASVGAVKFDHHPGFEFKSGDELFNN
jgi:2-keto-3-deoxy-6-phosphogluconate aldolase